MCDIIGVILILPYLRNMNYVYVCALAVNINFFVVGTCLSWSSPIQSKLESADTTPFDKALTPDETSWISALLPLGAVFGPFIFGYLADKIGRKYTLLICGVPFLVCYLSLAFGKVVGIYYAARFISGLALGGAFTVTPMYIGEIGENSNRGALGSYMNVFLCLGLTFSYSVGPYVSIMVFNLILAIFPGLFLVLFFLLGPESPHYLVSKQEHDLAKSALKRIRGVENQSIEEELIEIQTKIKEEGHGTFFDIFKSKGLIKAFIISVCLVAIQQLSGINAVLFYAQRIFQEAGTTLEPAVCSIIIGCTQFVSSFLSPLLSDRLGRKILFICSAVGMIISEVPLGLYSYLKDHDKDVSSIDFLPILCLIAYIITYNAAFGPLPWAVMGEVFPSNVKSIASAITAALCWFLGFLITKYFQAISDSIGMGPSFWIFSGFCVAAVPFCIFYLIETKGKSLQEIQNALNS